MKNLFNDIKDALFIVFGTIVAIVVGVFSLKQREKTEVKKAERAKRIKERNKKIDQVDEKLAREEKETNKLQKDHDQQVKELEKQLKEKEKQIKKVEQKIKEKKEACDTNDVQITEEEISRIIDSLDNDSSK